MSAFDDFLAIDLAVSRKLFRPDAIGTLVVQNAAVPATVLVAERRPLEAQQYQLSLPLGGKATRRLPAGVYAVTVTAKGHKPHRATIEIGENKITTLEPKLEEGEAAIPTFSQILAKYGIADDKPPPITLKAGERLTLDAKAVGFLPVKNLREVRVRSLDQAKRMLGHPDTLWPDAQSRFGADIPAKPEPGRELENSYAFRAAMREFIYGNSKSVAGWADTLNAAVMNNEIALLLGLGEIITVGPDAVLTIGTQGLLCDTLRVHVTGTVVVAGSGPSVIEMNTYQQFV